MKAKIQKRSLRSIGIKLLVKSYNIDADTVTFTIGRFIDGNQYGATTEKTVAVGENLTLFIESVLTWDVLFDV